MGIVAVPGLDTSIATAEGREIAAVNIPVERVDNSIAEAGTMKKLAAADGSSVMIVGAGGNSVEAVVAVLMESLERQGTTPESAGKAGEVDCVEVKCADAGYK